MFTGIIEETGTINALTKGKKLTLQVRAELVCRGTKAGDSIAVNGVCLTVTAIAKKLLSFDLMAETYNGTALRYLHQGAPVNLERAAAFDSRLGGHLISGHVDVVGTIQKIQKLKNLYLVSIAAPKQFQKYLMDKGSIAVDGISLTVQKKTGSNFQVGIIPHTLRHTNLAVRRAGAPVNLEFDLFAKYIENILAEKKVQEQSRLKKYLRG